MVKLVDPTGAQTIPEVPEGEPEVVLDVAPTEDPDVHALTILVQRSGMPCLKKTKRKFERSDKSLVAVVRPSPLTLVAFVLLILIPMVTPRQLRIPS